jgi:tRNA pseudouridine55 synthase
MAYLRMPDLSAIVSGTMIMVDKPLEWTSFDVVNKIRYAIRKTFQLKKIRVGHAGTLDPMASGLLIICTGKMTKQIDQYQAQEKTYQGIMTLGATTASFDSESPINGEYPIGHITSEMLGNQAQRMTGEIAQTPPIFSALKKDGIPLYKLARQGKEVDIPSRRVSIYSFELTRIALPEVHFSVRCSKGTYIRSLVHEFGLAINSGAYLKALKRTAIGDFQLSNAWNMEELINTINSMQAS